MMAAAPGRPRDPSVDERISRAALELLREQGPEAVHIDGVAMRSGVARTTIYRRFHDRKALITATLAMFGDDRFPDKELPLEDKLRWLLEQVRELVEEQLGRGAVAAVLADSDPVFSAALRAELTRRLTALQSHVAADVAGGRIRQGVDAEALAGLVFGAHLGELLQHGGARPGWDDGVIELPVHGIRPG
jgi:AcrR family transcriptional regulator